MFWHLQFCCKSNNKSRVWVCFHSDSIVRKAMAKYTRKQIIFTFGTTNRIGTKNEKVDISQETRGARDTNFLALSNVTISDSPSRTIRNTSFKRRKYTSVYGWIYSRGRTCHGTAIGQASRTLSTLCVNTVVNLIENISFHRQACVQGYAIVMPVTSRGLRQPFAGRPMCLALNTSYNSMCTIGGLMGWCVGVLQSTIARNTCQLHYLRDMQRESTNNNSLCVMHGCGCVSDFLERGWQRALIDWYSVTVCVCMMRFGICVVSSAMLCEACRPFPILLFVHRASCSSGWGKT